MARCETGSLEAEDWNVLKTRFIQNAPDASDPKWDDAPHLFHDNKSCFEYNMKKLKDIGTPITRLNAKHNNQKAAKKDSAAAQNLQAYLYLCDGADVMLTSNLWAEVGLHNGARGKVVDFVYKDSSGPRSGVLPEAVVVQFRALDESVAPFLPVIPNTVAIPTIQAEWLDNGKTLMRRQFPLMLSWAYTIHKSQGKTLDLAIIDLGKSEKCSGMTLVALSRVHKLSHLMIHPISLERLQKVNRSNSLPIIQDAYARLHLKFNSTKECFAHLIEH